VPPVRGLPVVHRQRALELLVLPLRPPSGSHYCAVNVVDLAILASSRFDLIITRWRAAGNGCPDEIGEAGWPGEAYL
jgi:hypothetical protein